MDNTYLLQSRRTDYLKKFQKTTTPLFIEGVYSIYNNVKKNNKSKRFLLKEFQQSMVDVSRWSQDIIRNEHSRFKKQSSVLDRLIRAIFDLDIIIKKDLCKNAADFIPEPWDFVHQCYLNIARALWKQPFLVYDVNIDKLTVQQNKLKIEKIVSLCIQDTFSQYLPLDIEHDDVSNIDYSIQQFNPDMMIQHSQEDVIETVQDYGDTLNETFNNDNKDEAEHDVDVDTNNVSVCNDNFKQLDYEVSSNLHEDLNVLHTKISEEDCDDKDIQSLIINDVEEYVNVENNENNENNDDKISDIIEYDDKDEIGDDEESDDSVISNEDDLVYVDDSGTQSNNEDIQSVDDTKSFHSDEIDVDSVKSEELFVSRIDPQEVQHDNYVHHDENIHKEEIKEIFIGNKNEYKQFSEDAETNDITTLPDVKVVHIDDSKARLTSRKDALLNIKKKVKSSMHHSREMENSKYERYGDKLRVERKNTSFF